MWRVLLFIALVFAAGFGFAWLADRPGEMAITFAGYRYQLSLTVAAALLVTLVAAVMILWWLVRTVLSGPRAIGDYFRARRRDRGYRALSAGMIAAGAGDSGLARKQKKEAIKLIGAEKEPLIRLLDAQASLLEGDHEGAREKFSAMLDDPHTRLLGLRGLYLEAERLGEREVARQYAAQAAGAAPQLIWAAEATMEERSERGDWEGALALVDAQRATRQVDREALDRRRAVLLTAKALDRLDADPYAARQAGLEAVKLAPDFVPAAIAAARALFRLDELRKGAKILEAAWKKMPHPEIADLYTHARHGDSTHDRLARAKKLASMRHNNPVSSLALARAALEAGELAEARASAETAIRLDPREGAYLLMADIEEAQSGEAGKVRQWLSRAVRAPRDPAWVADNYVSERWAPFSPVTGRIDAFEWRVPMERVAQMIDQAPLQDEPEPEPRRLPLAEAVEEAQAEKAGTVEIEAVAEKPVSETPPEPAAPEAPPAEAIADPQPPEPDAPKPGAPRPVPVKPAAAEPDAGEPAKAPARTAEVVVLPRPPDDPGVESDEQQEQEKDRFRLF